MPLAVRGEGMANQTNEVTIHGTVTSGVGAAGGFTELPWAQRQFETKLGFRPFPGTFNVRLKPADEEIWRVLRAQPGIEITPEPGACLSYCYPVLVNGRIRGAVLRPEVHQYPADIVEILADTHLRSTLGLAEGDEVELLVCAAMEGPEAEIPFSPTLPRLGGGS